MKKIPQVITQYEIMLVFLEGKTAFAEGRRRGYCPYADIDHDDLAGSWWSGWDKANVENQSEGNNAAPPNKNDEP
ncbi:MAG TPA: hypothetical protein VJ785_00330 [Anaerolineales bacterium]|nr:hypothetical protein [Anaerolineales bacterium]